MGLCLIPSQILQCLPPFYAHILLSYVMVNNLFYQEFDSSDLPQKLWCGKVRGLCKVWADSGLFTTADLPLDEYGCLHVKHTIELLQRTGAKYAPYIQCCAIQQELGLVFNRIPGTFVFNDQLLV